MRNRFKDAHLIFQGACNPSGIARSLVAACDEARAEGRGTDAVRRDPACRLITAQLAFLMGQGIGCYDGVENDMALCEKVAGFTSEQYAALKAVHERPTEAEKPTWLDFLRRVQLGTGGDCIMVEWAGMWLGIERDGYTHS